MSRKEQKFNVHQGADGKPILREPIDTLAFCIAISPNDKFVALGFSSKLWIYEIETNQTRHHQLPPHPDSSLDSQRITFSADSEEVIVVTRSLDGHVRTYVSKCMVPATESHFPNARISKVSIFDFQRF